MTEENLLDDIFDCKWTAKSGNKYVVSFCDLCDVFTISCRIEECRATTCNAGGCDICKDDFNEFRSHISYIEYYLTEEERKTYEKFRWLKKYIKESLVLGETTINWKRMKENGELCGITEEMFKKEIQKSYEEQS